MNTLGLTFYSAWSAARVGITHTQSNSPKYMDRVHQLRTRIFAANCASLGFGLVQLARCIPKETLDKYRYVYNHRARRKQDEIGGLICLGLVCAGLVAIGLYFVATAINRLGRPSAETLDLDRWYSRYDPDATPEQIAEMQQNCETNWANSNYQTATQTVYLCSLVTNCALAIFAKHALLYSLLAALQVSGVLAVARWRFVKLSFTREIVPNQNQNPLDFVQNILNQMNVRRQKFRYNYLFSVFQSSVRDNSMCTPCQEEGADIYFCPQHRFHFPCILGSAIAKFREMHFNKGTRFITQHTRNGVHTHNSISYSFKVKQDKLPSCPNCRGTPSQNELGIDAWEGGRWMSGSVTVE